MKHLAATRARRLNCRLHFLRRASERGLSINAYGAYRLERRIGLSIRAFSRPDIDRYLLTLRIGPDRIVVIYDAHLHCLVTVLKVERFIIGPMRRMPKVRHA